MDSKELHVLIEHWFLMGKNTTQSRNSLINVIAHLLHHIKQWSCGILNLNVDVHPRMMLNIQVDEMRKLLKRNIKKVHRIHLDDRKIKLSEIADMVTITTERVHHILHGHFMASMFWYAHSIIFIAYLKNGKTVTGKYCFALLTRLDEVIRKKRPHLKKRKILFH